MKKWSVVTASLLSKGDKEKKTLDDIKSNTMYRVKAFLCMHTSTCTFGRIPSHQKDILKSNAKNKVNMLLSLSSNLTTNTNH